MCFVFKTSLHVTLPQESFDIHNYTHMRDHITYPRHIHICLYQLIIEYIATRESESPHSSIYQSSRINRKIRGIDRLMETIFFN